MKYPLEIERKQAVVFKNTGLVFIVDDDGVFAKIPNGMKFITVCCGHDYSVKLTANLCIRGFTVSHGLCEKCRENYDNDLRQNLNLMSEETGRGYWNT